MRDMNYDGDRDVIAGALEKQHMPISAPNSDQRNVLAVLVAVLAAVLEETILWESIDHRDIFIICATKAYILYTYIIHLYILYIRMDVKLQITNFCLEGLLGCTGYKIYSIYNF